MYSQLTSTVILFGFIILGVLYFLPTIVAFFREKRNVWAIFALNLFLGVTGIGWVVALVWALTKDSVLVQVESRQK